MPDPLARKDHTGPADRLSPEALERELTHLRAKLAAAERQRDELRNALDTADGRERMLSNELQHRVRNLLSVIRSIYRRTLESGASQEGFAEHFEGRLDVISRYQADLVELRHGGIELEDVIRDELLRVHVDEGPKLRVTGPSVRLNQKSLELMALAIHELTINAIKFGALYHQGSLEIDWTLSGPPRHKILHLRWHETSIPLVAAAPRPHGFGRQLVEEALPYQLGATTSFEFKPGTFECSITLPLGAMGAAAEADRQTDDDDVPFFPPEPEWSP